MLDQEKIGRFIASLRKEKKMTQEQLAEKLGVSNRSVSRWENGNSMPDLSMLPMISEELEVTVSELLDGERAAKENESKDYIGKLIELTEQEKQRKTKMINRYFFTGFLCAAIAIFHWRFGILSFAKEPELLQGILLGLGMIFEIAGFYYNSKERKYTDREIAVLSGNEQSVKMRTAGEMLQFAKRNQKAELKQYKKAFQAIEGKLLPEETVKFSMVADSFIVNEEWTDSWSPWHVALAVTDDRLMVCGEAIHGRFMTFYDVESFALGDIVSVGLVNRKIVIGMENNELKIEGKNFETVIELLKNALKK